MRDRRYPIYGEPGVAWVLVFDPTTSKWMVEEVRAGPKARLRFELSEFEASDTGRPMAGLIAKAVALAANDA